MTRGFVIMLAILVSSARQARVYSLTNRLVWKRDCRRNIAVIKSLSLRQHGPNRVEQDDMRKPVESFLENVLTRAEQTLSNKGTWNTADDSEKQTDDCKPIKSLSLEEHDDVDLDLERHLSNSYNTNPTIATTALAHVLWSHVLRPGIDTAIDATAGNGNDSLVLARLLFGSLDDNNNDVSVQVAPTCKLYCIDIQEQACQKTKQRLESTLGTQIMREHVQVLQCSHAPLPVTRDVARTVGLVVYNLGFLPQSNTKDTCITTAETTLSSLVNASLLLRVGGMLSVTTYPKTNRLEHVTVSAFLEGLALLTSTTRDWTDFMDSLLDMDIEQRQSLHHAVQQVQKTGRPSQTWRVHQHAKIGWTDAPILLTATRIK